eukprot:scaffold88747_cov69-Phaeocystis_antarctica.AAC.2
MPSRLPKRTVPPAASTLACSSGTDALWSTESRRAAPSSSVGLQSTARQSPALNTQTSLPPRSEKSASAAAPSCSPSCCALAWQRTRARRHAAGGGSPLSSAARSSSCRVAAACVTTPLPRCPSKTAI